MIAGPFFHRCHVVLARVRGEGKIFLPLLGEGEDGVCFSRRSFTFSNQTSPSAFLETIGYKTPSPFRGRLGWGLLLYRLFEPY